MKRNKDFRYVYRVGKSVGSRVIVLVYARNKANNVRIGFSVSKKIGNSVMRNRIKRRLREAFSPLLPEIKVGHSLIFIAREPIKGEEFIQIQNTLRYLLRKADLLLKEADGQ